MTSFSVIIPARNAEESITRTLNSVAAQTVGALETIVVDDGSTDATAAIAHTCGARILRGGGLGVSHARNVGVEAARGDYLAFLDADDAWPPEHLATATAVVDETGAEFICSHRIDVYRDGPPNYRALSLGDLTPGALLAHNRVTTSGVVVSRAAFLALGPFDVALSSYGEDADLWVRLAQGGVKAALLPTAVLYSVRDGREPIERLRVMEHRRQALLLKHKASVTRSIRSSILLDIGRRYQKGQHRREARRLFLLAQPSARALVFLVVSFMPTYVEQKLRTLARRLRT